MKNIHALKTLAAAVLAVASQTNFAQPVSASAPSPAKTALINKLVQLQQPLVENVARLLIQQPVANLMQGAGVALQQVPTDKREAAAKTVEADVRKFVDETVPMMRERGAKLAPSTWAPTLDERFSEEELKQVIAWLESPTSKKYQQVGAEMQNTLAQKLVADTRGTVEARLKTLDQTVSKDLGISPAKPAASATKK